MTVYDLTEESNGGLENSIHELRETLEDMSALIIGNIMRVNNQI